MECETILSERKTTAYCQKLFGVTQNTPPHEINRAFKRLSLKFHPDKNPDHKDIADKVQPLLSNMRNHLITGEPLEQGADESLVSIHKLLENMEMRVLMNQDIKAQLNTLEERVQKNPNYLFAVSPHFFFTPLRLAVYANDVATFKKWTEINSDALTSTADTVCLSALHYLMREHMSSADESGLSIDTPKPKAQMLAYIQQRFPKEWWIAVCQESLLTQTYPDVLNFCVQYLQQNQTDLDPTLFTKNPFLAATTWGNTNFKDPVEKYSFYFEHMRNYPDLRKCLQPEQKNSPETILAQHYHLEKNIFYPLTELQDFVKNTEVSPYFVSALLDTLPRCKKEIKLIDKQNPHALTYVSLNRIYQTTIALTTALVSTAFYLAYTASNMIPMVAAGILLAITIGLIGKIIYAECKKHEEKNKINSYLIRHNYFKPDQQILEGNESFELSQQYLNN